MVSLSTGLECGAVKDLASQEEVIKSIKTPLASMQYGNEDFLAELVAQACSEQLTHTHTHTHTHTPSLSCTHIHVYKHMYTHIHCVHTHTHTLSLSHTHTHIHTCQMFSFSYGYVSLLLNDCIGVCILLAVSTLPDNPKSFNVDNVRVSKILVSERERERERESACGHVSSIIATIILN